MNRKAPRKPCPSCGAHIHTRRVQCSCGHSFRKRTVIEEYPNPNSLPAVTLDGMMQAIVQRIEAQVIENIKNRLGIA